jgi:hypothetical protein
MVIFTTVLFLLRGVIDMKYEVPHSYRVYRGEIRDYYYSQLKKNHCKNIQRLTYCSENCEHTRKINYMQILPSDKFAVDRKNYTTIDCGNIQNG